MDKDQNLKYTNLMIKICETIFKLKEEKYQNAK